MDYYPPVPKNWFQRNWKWFVPTGCLGLIVLVALFATAVIFGVTSMMKSSDVYMHSMDVVQKNRQVIEKIGNHIKPDGVISGNISTSNNSGNAQLEIPVKGSKGAGSIHVIAQKESNIWVYRTMEFYISDSGETINLLEEDK
jgi:hypothetical protein